MKKKEEYTTEWCPFCNTEQDIPVTRMSDCPACGNPIKPCSACNHHDTCPDNCPF